MQVSERGIAFIKDAEGFRAKAYQDQVGRWTLGFGLTHIFGRPVRSGDSITDVQAEYELRQWLHSQIEPELSKELKVPVTQSVFDSLSSLAYNEGIQAVLQSTLLKLLNSGDLVGASNEFPKWDMAGGNVNPGLLSRRLREQSMFNEKSPQ